MLGNSLNLVDIIRGYLPGDAIGRMSSIIGESSDRTRAAINAGIPGLLMGLERATSTNDGVERINVAIDDADDRILDKGSDMFGRGFVGDTGSGLLNSIMGTAGHSELTTDIGRASGLSGKEAVALLSLLTPIVFGVLKRVKRNFGPDRFDVAELLASQRSNISAAVPHRATEETRTGPRVAARETVSDSYTRAKPHTTSGSAWIFPIILFLGGLGLIWWLGRSHENRFAANRTVHAGGEGTTPVPGRAQLSMDQLKLKYNAVLREAMVQGIDISNLRMENGKLVIIGTAPSVEAANNVWNEIKRVDPSLTEISADLRVTSSESRVPMMPERPMAPSVTEQPNTESAADNVTGGQMYTVKRGDTLTSISKHFYGDASGYKRILDANSDTVKNKDLVRVGQELSIPEKSLP